MSTFLLVHGAVTGCVAVFSAVLIIFTLLSRPLYRRRWQRTASAMPPSVAVFVPCKGVEDDTAENVRRVIALDWPQREIFFLVESTADPAHGLLASAVSGRCDARVVVTGHSLTCAQKLHNLVGGVAASRGNGEVLVFLDSDLGVDPAWLHRLLEPFADPRVAATAGATWLVPAHRTLAERGHAFWFSLVRVMLSFPGFNSVAGCSTAIRRSEFETLGVAEAWKSSLSDDISLMRILGAARRKAVFVPTCLGITHGGASSLRQLLAWIGRQCQMVKYNLRPLWVMAGLAYGLVYANLLALPALAVVATFHPALLPLLIQAGACTLFFCVGASLLRIGVRDGERPTVLVLLSPVFIVLSYTGFIVSAFNRTVRWGNATYRMSFDGRVKEIVRE
jgi:ceramide glucosyltransferase